MFKFGDKVRIIDGQFVHNTGIALREYHVAHISIVDIRVDNFKDYNDSRHLDCHSVERYKVIPCIEYTGHVSPPWVSSEPVKEAPKVQAGPRYRTLTEGSKRKIGYEYRMKDSDTWCPGKIRSIGRVITVFNAANAEYRIPVREKVKKEKGPRYKYYKFGDLVPGGTCEWLVWPSGTWVKACYLGFWKIEIRHGVVRQLVK